MDANGKVELEKLPPGQYFFQETFTPEGYRGDTNTYSFVVGNNGLIDGQTKLDKVVTNNKYRRLYLLKADTEAEAGREDLYYELTDFPDGTEFYVYEWDETLQDYAADPIMHIGYKPQES